MSSSSDFYVQALNVSIDASYAQITGVDTTSFDCSVNATFDLQLSAVQDLFRFHTDATDINDDVVNDIRYRVNYTNVTDLDNEDVLTADWLSGVALEAGGDSIYEAQSTIANQTVPFEFVRYLAKKLFNTHLGVDLFSNEADLRNDLHRAGKVALNTHLTALNDLTSTDADTPENSAYLTSTEAAALPEDPFGGHPHPSYAILQQILNQKRERLDQGLSSLLISGTETYPEFKMPFIEDDNIFFKLTIRSAEGQNEVVEGTGKPDDRTYKIRIHIVANPQV